MYLFILLFPLLIYPWGPEPYYTVPKLFYLVFFVFSMWLILVFKREKWREYSPHSFTSVEIILGFFISFVVLSTIFSVNKQTALFGSMIRFEGMITILSYCSLLVFSYRMLNPSVIEKTIKGIVAISVLVSIYGILQHYMIDFLPRSSIRIDYTRSYAFFDNPNFFGAYLVLVIMLSISQYLKVNSQKAFFYYFFSTCISFIAMIFSSTRSAWIGVAFGMILLTFLVVWKRKELWKRWVLMILTFVSLFVAIDLTEDGGNFKRAYTTVTDSYQIATNKTTGHEGSSRFFIWKKSLPLIPEYFWLGSGPDTLKDVIVITKKEKEEYLYNPDANVDKAHNEYLQMAITLGVPALIVYLLLIGLIVKNAFEAAKRSQGQESLILYGLISTIFAYLVQAFFNISVIPVAPLFWVLLGITYSFSVKNLGLCKHNKFENKAA